MSFNIKEQKIDWWLFMVVLILNFMPFYLATLAFVFIFLFLILNRTIGPSLLIKNKTSLFFSLFATYSLIISLFFHNVAGVAMSLFYFIAILYLSYYHEHAPPDLFDQIINVCMILSLSIFAYTLLEYFNIVPEWDYSFIHPDLNSNHSNRVEATFFNPNYYAMVLEFLIIMGLYKIATSNTPWHQSFYLFIVIANCLAVIFTGNRTAPVVVALAVFVFFYVIAFKRTAIFIALIIMTVMIIFILSGYYPRLEDLSWAINDRIDIWHTAWEGIKENFIFGRGPYTYTLVYDDYGGKFTYHAHNIYLDTLLNYGIVGGFILCLPIIRYCRWLFSMHQYPQMKEKAALYSSFVCIFLVHGLTDMSIYWFQTMAIFMPIMLLLPTQIKSLQTN